MSKYSKELKLKIVLGYIEKHISPEQQGKNERSKIKKLSYF